MRKLYRITAIMLIVVLSACMTVSAYATSEKIIVDVDGSEIVNYSDVLPAAPVHGEDFLGRWDDAIFDNSPTVYPNINMYRSSDELFSMEATGVRDFLVTGSNKEFAKADLDNGNLKITGDILNSYSPNAFVRIGGCWYDSISDEWVRDGYREVECDGDINVTIAKREFVPDMMLRGFIKNISGVGSITGHLYFFNSST